MDDLATQQALFWQTITQAATHLSPPVVNAWQGSATFPVTARLQIYADMYKVRLLDALAHDFPCTAQLLGASCFTALGLAYVQAKPSTHPSLDQFGQYFAAFLNAAHSDLPTYPAYTGSLAALEWSRNRMFVAADSTPLSMQALANCADTPATQLRFKLSPSLELLSLPYDVTPLWRTLDAKTPQADPTPLPTLCSLAVWRRVYTVYHTRLDTLQATALQQAAAGASLATLAATFSAADEPQTAAIASLGAWFADGWIVGVIS